MATAYRKGQIGTVKKLITDGALEEYYLGIYDEKESGTLERINNKVHVVGMILDLGLAIVPTNRYIRYHPSDRKLFNVTLIPGTDLAVKLLVNLTVVKNESLIKEGNIPLHIICALPDVPYEIVQLFLESGTVGIDVHDESNHLTALMVAVARGNLEVVKFLVENGANVNNTAFLPLDPQGRLGFHYDYVKVFTRKAIVVPNVRIYFSALVAAVYENQPEILRYLLKNGADVNVRGQAWTALFNPVFTGKSEIVKILLKNGIDVNSKDVLGSTALQKAVEKGDIEMAKLLLKFEADANITDNFGWNALHVASLFSRNASKAMIELMLDSGCDVNSLTDGGFSPLNLAEAGNNLNFLDYLVRNLEKIQFSGHKELHNIDSDEKHLEVISLLIDRGADVDHEDDILGWTTLHWAAASGDLKVTKMLVEKHEAVMTSRSKLGMTPFGTAKHFRRKEVAEYLNADRNLVY